MKYILLLLLFASCTKETLNKVNSEDFSGNQIRVLPARPNLLIIGVSKCKIGFDNTWAKRFGDQMKVVYPVQ